VEKNFPILGVVAIPALNIFYGAEKEQGAFKIDKDGRRKIACKSNRSELICADSRFHSSAAVQGFCQKYGIKKINKYGSL